MAGMPDWSIGTNGAELGHAALGPMPLIMPIELLGAHR